MRGLKQHGKNFFKIRKDLLPYKDVVSTIYPSTSSSFLFLTLPSLSANHSLMHHPAIFPPPFQHPLTPSIKHQPFTIKIHQPPKLPPTINLPTPSPLKSTHHHYQSLPTTIKANLVEYYYLWKKTPAAFNTRPHRRHRRPAFRRQAPTPTLPQGDDSQFSSFSSLPHQSFSVLLSETFFVFFFF